MTIDSRQINILLVEDDEMVRLTTRDILERSGFSIVMAESPHEALNLCTSGESQIDLIITDVIMPDKNGLELQREITAVRPDIKFIFTSGHPANVIEKEYGMTFNEPFLQKPSPIKALLEKIKEVIGQ